MKQLLLGFLLFVFVACAPTASAPTNVSPPPTPAPTLTFAPTQLVPTATQVLPTNLPTNTLVPTKLPTLTNTPVPAKTATFQGVATLWSSPEKQCKIAESFKGVASTKDKIAYTSQRDESTEVYLMSVDGLDGVPLTKNCYPGGLSWSPDGKKLVFSGHGDEIYSNEIYVLDMTRASLSALLNLPRPSHGQPGFPSVLIWCETTSPQNLL